MGYERALASVGIPPRGDLVSLGAHGRYEARELAARMLAADERPTAIFAASDTQALGVMSAAHDAGIHVPDDLSVIGYDDIEMAEYIGLTTDPSAALRVGTTWGRDAPARDRAAFRGRPVDRADPQRSWSEGPRRHRRRIDPVLTISVPASTKHTEEDVVFRSRIASASLADRARDRGPAGRCRRCAGHCPEPRRLGRRPGQPELRYRAGPAARLLRDRLRPAHEAQRGVHQAVPERHLEHPRGPVREPHGRRRRSLLASDNPPDLIRLPSMVEPGQERPAAQPRPVCHRVRLGQVAAGGAGAEPRQRGRPAGRWLAVRRRPQLQHDRRLLQQGPGGPDRHDRAAGDPRRVRGPARRRRRTPASSRSCSGAAPRAAWDSRSRSRT